MSTFNKSYKKKPNKSISFNDDLLTDAQESNFVLANLLIRKLGIFSRLLIAGESISFDQC